VTTQSEKATAIDYMVCPFTPGLLQRSAMGNEAARSTHESSPIKFPAHFMAGMHVPEYIEFMDECGIQQSLVASVKFGTIFDAPSRLTWDVTADEISAIVEQAPDRLRGVYGINPLTRMDGVREMERTVRDHGFVGAYIHPYEFGPINHRMWYPFFTKAIELDIPVIAQIGHSGGIHHSSYARPILVDDVACDLPELKFVASHTGWPWVEELIAAAWKHPNVYIGTAAHMPKYWDASLVRFINSRGQDKVMWGTDIPFYDGRRMLEQLGSLDLREGALAKLLCGNARRVFKL
jgi:predicted TIM-barrel fold metal-dependent hydrolase